MTDRQGLALAELMRKTGAQTATLSLASHVYGDPAGGVYVGLVVDGKYRHESIPSDPPETP